MSSNLPRLQPDLLALFQHDLDSRIQSFPKDAEGMRVCQHSWDTG